MKTKIGLIILQTLLFQIVILNSQVTVLNNGGGIGAFNGWNAAVFQPVDIEHKDATPFTLQPTTTWPIFFKTAGFERMRIEVIVSGEGLQSYFGALVNPFPGNEMTRVRIGYAGNVTGTPSALIPPVSLLHIGTDDPTPIVSGMRSWQNIGMNCIAGTDHIYVGMREKTGATGRTSVITTNIANAQDAVINWGDNYGPCHLINGAQTNLVFQFTSHLNGIISPCTSTDETNSDYGRELMRMVPSGQIGIGQVFDDSQLPQNMLHIAGTGTNEAYLQITRQTNGMSGPLDGLKLGVDNTGDGVLWLAHPRDLKFYTAGAQRAVLQHTTGNFGVNTGNPQNRVEITSASPNPYFGSPVGSSGLRLTNLTATNSAMPNGSVGVNSSQVLTVDQNGDVVLTNPIPLNGLGNQCSLTPVPLLTNHEIPLGGFDFNFTGDASNTNKVSIGYPCGSTTGAKLNVTTAFDTNGSTFGVGIQSEVTATSTAVNLGILANAIGASNWNIGVEATSFGSGNNSFGGFFHAQNGSVLNVGVHGTSFGGGGSSNSFGGEFYAQGGSGVNIGVSGTGFLSNVLTGITYPTSCAIGVYGRCANNSALSDFAGYFDGNVRLNGSATGTGWATVSDQIFKTNVDTIANALNTINLLQPKTFFLDTTNIYGMRFRNTRQYGLIAQQTASVLPEIVINQIKPATVDTLGSIVTPSIAFKAVDYGALTGIMIRAIQQLSAQNRAQDSLLQQLLNCCENPGGGGRMGGTPPKYQMDVELSNNYMIVLDQNVPNPFAENCVIGFDIPIDFNSAQMIFSNGDGRVLKTVEIKEKGRGQLNVYASDLTNGLYTYFLKVDGKIIDTKKLVKQN